MCIIKHGIEKTIESIDLLLSLEQNTNEDIRYKLKQILEKILEKHFLIKIKDVLTARYKNNLVINDCKVIYFNLLKDFCGFESVEILKMFNLTRQQRGVLYSKFKAMESAKFLYQKRNIKQKILVDYESILNKANSIKEKIIK